MAVIVAEDFIQLCTPTNWTSKVYSEDSNKQWCFCVVQASLALYLDAACKL
ncbi:hypothetical protein AHF37_12297 [Paragonimus kellicotti]|nr:hypothetical protein AHF37_12297 [Paragonimus kellicotti]